MDIADLQRVLHFVLFVKLQDVLFQGYRLIFRVFNADFVDLWSDLIFGEFVNLCMYIDLNDVVLFCRFSTFRIFCGYE